MSLTHFDVLDYCCDLDDAQHKLKSIKLELLAIVYFQTHSKGCLFLWLEMIFFGLHIPPLVELDSPELQVVVFTRIILGPL